MAYSEGLLSAKTQTDGVFERICTTPIDYRVRQQLLEQLVLTPTIAFNRCDELVWAALTGELLDKGHIINVNDPKPEIFPQAEQISFEIIAGLVRAAGEDIHPSRFRQIADAAIAARTEEDEYVARSGKEPPSLIKKGITDVLNQIGLEIPGHYTEEEYEAQCRRNEKYRAFAPIGAALDEYLSVAQSATRHNMVLKTPQFSDAGQTQLVNPNFVAGASSNELILFRVVASQLGKTTFRPTIRGCLALSRDPATVALREQLELWKKMLPEGGEDQLKVVQREIGQAQKAISRLSGVETVGTIATWLSVPVATTELMLALAPVLGISVGVAGKVSSATVTAVTRKYEWAMFGNT
jgi:hypothetical protein